ncbi:restriction endonuclease subunit S [Comamonas aquatica]|uniref:restriction endonuclease subunit S n=1 Tax=Comamonas aquatica TaxID=225991 RepID=UPI003D0443A8
MMLSNLNLLATAPGGVARLRELILTLAVQGKLVPQDPADEPASVLLQKIRAEKDRLIAEGKIKKDKQLAAIAEEEKPFELPMGWSFCRLGDLLLSIRSGGTPSKQNPVYWGGDIPWASVKDLKFGEPLTDTQDRITIEGLQAGSQLAIAGSILICTRMGLGKIGEALIDVAINQDLKAVQLGAGVHKQHFINFFKTLSVVGSGMTVAGIKQDELLGFVVPLPPEAEQSRIVARVEELMRLCDALEAKGQLEATQHAQLLSTLLGTLTASATPEELAENWQRVAQHFDLLLDRPQAIDALEQTLLQLAVRGLLVPQDPADEPASVLLQKIRAEKDRLIAAGQIKRDKPLPPVTDEEQPFELPVGWEWGRLEQLSIAIVDCPHSTPKFVESGRLCLDTNSFKQGVLLPHKLRFVDDSTFVERNARLAPQPGDLVFAREGSVGESILIPDGVDACLGQRVMLFRFSTQVSKEFVRLAISSTSFLDALLAMHKGIGAKHVNVGDMRKAVIPLPPLFEQSRIVTRVTQLRRLCADLRQRLAEREVVQARLAEALAQSVA